MRQKAAVDRQGRLTVRTEQPGAEAILKDNLRRQVDPAAAIRKSDFMQPLARIPEIVTEHWRREGRQDLLRGDRKAMERYLNSSEGRALRTAKRGKARSFSFGGI